MKTWIIHTSLSLFFFFFFLAVHYWTPFLVGFYFSVIYDRDLYCTLLFHIFEEVYLLKAWITADNLYLHEEVNEPGLIFY